ncbi:MAG: tetratricopeptide repeat protein [Bacteroidales bacterium]
MACNICHTDKSPEWSQRSIDKTHNREYQDGTIKAGLLIKEARRGDWERLAEITSGLTAGEFDPVFKTSFLRLLENCEDPAKWDAVLEMTGDPSPLVRSAAAHSLAYNYSEEAYLKLFQLTDDEYRLVRLNAGYSLATYPANYFTPGDSAEVNSSIREYRVSLTSRPDDWSSYYNLGNFYVNRGDYQAALSSYSIALRLFPGAVMPLVNSGYIYSLTGRDTEAEVAFQEALASSPDHPAALLNLALLYGEQGRVTEAEAYFRRLLTVSPENSVAAYNLGIIVSGNDPSEALKFSKMAYEWNPGEPRYLYTYSYFLYREGEADEAIELLEELIEFSPVYPDAFFLLASIYRDRGDEKKVAQVMDMLLNEKIVTEETRASARRFKER